MKQLAVLLVFLTTFGAMAQKHDGPNMRQRAMADMTAEQVATLHTKKMTLVLDLTDKQAKKIMAINLEEAERRKAKRAEIKAKKESGEWKRPTSDERFEIANARLDHQIAQHQKMKEVLTEEQYQTWKKLKLKKVMNGKKKMQEKGRRG